MLHRSSDYLFASIQFPSDGPPEVVDHTPTKARVWRLGDGIDQKFRQEDIASNKQELLHVPLDWRDKLSTLKNVQQYIYRKRAEAAARRVSESIDEQLRQERIALAKNRPIKILLLSQSESDRVAVLKNLQQRIASLGSDDEPRDDDTICTRLQAGGVQEHKFVVEKEGRRTEWVLYDVSGTRSSASASSWGPNRSPNVVLQRAVWETYFDDVDTILFLSPISCFDESLPEDPRVNQLEDSYQLWRTICSSRMLARTQIMLILTQCDLLEEKLAQGIRVKDFIPSFGERQNDISTAVQYFQSHFRDISKRVSPGPRPFFVHVTSAIDTRATAAMLSVVEESVLRKHLRNATLFTP